jgi:hypothetical protein
MKLIDSRYIMHHGHVLKNARAGCAIFTILCLSQDNKIVTISQGTP